MMVDFVRLVSGFGLWILAEGEFIVMAARLHAEAGNDTRQYVGQHDLGRAVVGAEAVAGRGDDGRADLVAIVGEIVRGDHAAQAVGVEPQRQAGIRLTGEIDNLIEVAQQIIEIVEIPAFAARMTKPAKIRTKDNIILFVESRDDVLIPASVLAQTMHDDEDGAAGWRMASNYAGIDSGHRKQ